MTTYDVAAVKPWTEAECIAHFKAGTTVCLVCDNDLRGYWTDYNGQIKCSTCGMTYQILGCHLNPKYLEKYGLTKEDIAQRYCDSPEIVPLLKAYWQETKRIIPLGMYMSDPPWSSEDVESLRLWMRRNIDVLEPLYSDDFDWGWVRGEAKQ